MKVRRIDHIGINVTDINEATKFFLELGLENSGDFEIEGDWVDKIVGLEKVSAKIAYLKASEGDTEIELVQYRFPPDPKGVQPCLSNTLGIRHIAFEVDDIEATVTKMAALGYPTVGEIQQYKDIYKLGFLRGPDGIILEVSQKLG